MSVIQPILGVLPAKLQVYCKTLCANGLFFGGLFVFSGKLFRVLLPSRIQLCPNMLLTGGDVNLRFFRFL